MSLYLDTSVIIPTLVDEDSSFRVVSYLQSAAQERLVTEFTASEVASALSRRVRIGEFTEVDAQRRLSVFDRWRTQETDSVAVIAADFTETSGIVRRFDLKLLAPDALHIAIARRIGATLVTLDVRQADAADALGLAVDRVSG